MFLQIIIWYYTTYQAVQFFCLKQGKVVTNLTLTNIDHKIIQK